MYMWKARNPCVMRTVGSHGFNTSRNVTIRCPCTVQAAIRYPSDSSEFVAHLCSFLWTHVNLWKRQIWGIPYRGLYCISYANNTVDNFALVYRLLHNKVYNMVFVKLFRDKAVHFMKRFRQQSRFTSTSLRGEGTYLPSISAQEICPFSVKPSWIFT